MIAGRRSLSCYSSIHLVDGFWICLHFACGCILNFKRGPLGLSPTKPSKRPVSNSSNQAALGLGDFAYCPAPALALHSSGLHSLHPVSVHAILDLGHINPHESSWLSSPGPFAPTQPLFCYRLINDQPRHSFTQYLEAHDRLRTPLYLQHNIIPTCIPATEESMET
jgi:hypothetical protein